MNKALEKALARQQEIVAAATAENRELTDAETREFNGLQAIIDELNADESAETERGASVSQTKDEETPEPEKRSETPSGGGYSPNDAAQIAAMCRFYGVNAGEFFARNLTVEQARREIMDAQMRDNKPIGARIRITEDERDKFTRAAADGLMLRGGSEITNPAPGANNYRAISLRDLAIESLERADSGKDFRHMDTESLLSAITRDFYNPESAFPSIMDEVVQKSYIEGLKKSRTTFEQWVRIGSLPNFKATTNHEYIMSLGGKLERVPENGELKAYVPKDVKMPGRQLDTFGRQFTMSRKAFIDDDIGLLTSMPRRYAEMSMRTQNDAVYDLLLGSGKIYDGKPFFDASRGNLITKGTGVTMEAMQQMIYMIGIQKDEAGNQLALIPDLFIVPFGIGVEVQKLLTTPTFYSAEGTVTNPYYNSNYTIVEDVTINSKIGEGKPLPWFMGMKGEIVQVDYLNGQREATIRRSERPGTLGFVWDVFFDFGVAPLHPQAACRNPGIELKFGE